MAQQTAVEWLEKQLLSHTKIENSKYIQQNVLDIALWQFNKYLEQAKQMEKEQIMKAVYNTMEFDPNVEAAEKYYNKTYNNENI